MKFFLTLLLLPLTLWGQNWTEPVNISPNMPGLDNQPDLCIDKNGILHCVFTHKLESNWRKIYYSKSIDDGVTWTTPEDISLNPDTSLMNPHIIADTNNKLYVTYDYNTGNPAATLVKLKTLNGNQWSAPFVVSEGMYNSDYNKLCIDHNNRIYVFWGYLNHWTNYRYYENGQWSDIISPYPELGVLETMSLVVDADNNLHCIGWGFYNSEPYAIYFSYLYDNTWSDWTLISPSTNLGSVGGADIDIFTTQIPAIAYRQKTYETGPNNDSTMYTFFNGNAWSEPELVVNDPYEQNIAIDTYNRIHIVDREKQETGMKLVHYQKVNDMWQGYVVDIADFYIVLYSLEKSTQKLYIAYYRSDVEGEGDIYFSSYDIVTGQKEFDKQNVIKELNIYPNPFKTTTSIAFTINEQREINISIYDLNARLVKTIENKEFLPGTYKYKWFGTDKNRKEVKAGLYLVRLLTGRYVITKPVEYVK
jgi:hypothetical protein